MQHDPLAIHWLGEERGVLVGGRQHRPQASHGLEVRRRGQGDSRAIPGVGRVGDDPLPGPDLRYAGILTAPLFEGVVWEVWLEEGLVGDPPAIYAIAASRHPYLGDALRLLDAKQQHRLAVHFRHARVEHPGGLKRQVVRSEDWASPIPSEDLVRHITLPGPRRGCSAGIVTFAFGTTQSCESPPVQPLAERFEEAADTVPNTLMLGRSVAVACIALFALSRSFLGEGRNWRWRGLGKD